MENQLVIVESPVPMRWSWVTGYVWLCNRHTSCSWLDMAGATVKDNQELAGRKTVTMSARYARLSTDHKLAVIDRIASVRD